MAVNTANMVPVDELIFADNVRTEECLQIPAMIASMERQGYLPDCPLTVSLKSDGKLLVLRGNRRGLALFHLKEHSLDTFRQICPGGKVPAIVHRGLTAEEEVLLRIDHSVDNDRVPLDEWSLYQAIRQLVKIGHDTQERVADKLGLFHAKGKNKGQPNRSYVQPRINLCRLPLFVQDEFEKRCREPDSSPVRWGMIASLYKAFMKEFVDYPEGDGPEFAAAWTKSTTPLEPKSADDSNPKKPLTPIDAVKRAQAASSPLLRQALLSVTGQADTSLAEIDSEIVAGSIALTLLAQIKEYLGDNDYTELVKASREQATAKAENQEVVTAEA